MTLTPRSRRARARTTAAAAAVGLLLALPTAPAHAEDGYTRCATVSLPVPLTEGGPADQRISGTLCTPAGGARTIQVLVPGGTYGQTYWFLRGTPGRPSFAATMVAAGHAVFAFDRLGSGASSHPPSTAFVADTHVTALREVLAAARSGALGGRGHTAVVAVGNSVGSTLIRSVAVDHPGALDAIVLTGETDTPSASAFAAFAEDLHPANREPRFAARGVDDGYYTTRPGTRQHWFYHLPGADQAVVDLDESSKEPDVYVENAPLPPENQAIRVPVLMVVGQYDRLLCGPGATDCSSSAALYRQEKRWYPRTWLTTVVVPDTGHALALHRSAAHTSALTRDWVDRAVGRG